MSRDSLTKFQISPLRFRRKFGRVSLTPSLSSATGCKFIYWYQSHIQFELLCFDFNGTRSINLYLH